MKLIHKKQSDMPDHIAHDLDVLHSSLREHIAKFNNAEHISNLIMANVLSHITIEVLAFAEMSKDEFDQFIDMMKNQFTNYQEIHGEKIRKLHELNEKESK